MNVNDTRVRCPWAVSSNPRYTRYHDEEWGVPVFDEQKMFEFIALESFQAGLSWEIILNKRENFRSAFDGFDPGKVAEYGEDKIALLRSDKGIVRNEAKIRATVNNARRFLEVAGEFGGFANYLWNFVNGEPIVNGWKTDSEIPASTPLSDEISTNMKERGFKFFGTTVCYAHMQAVGMVNDHIIDCFRHRECATQA